MDLQETTGKIERRSEKDGRLSIFITGQWYSQFFTNKYISAETKQAMENCQIGETWKVGWSAKGEFRNIQAMERIIDVNDDLPPTPRKSNDTRERSIEYQACARSACIAYGGAWEVLDKKDFTPESFETAIARLTGKLLVALEIYKAGKADESD